jgi:hypothetical protein
MYTDIGKEFTKSLKMIMMSTHNIWKRFKYCDVRGGTRDKNNGI